MKKKGDRCPDRIHHLDHADEFDVTHAGLKKNFINSSLALVLHFRRRFVSVCNVQKGIKTHGFTETRMSALLPVGCCHEDALHLAHHHV